MVSFLEYLKEAKSPDSSKIIEVSNKSDLKKLSDEYLRTLVHFLLDISGNSLESIVVDLEKSTSSKGGIAGYSTQLKTKLYSRNARADLAKSILKQFDDGPLFVQKRSSSDCNFLWYGNKDKIEDWLRKNHADDRLAEWLSSKDLATKQQAVDLFEYGRTMKDNLASGSKSQGSANSRYSIAFFHVDDVSVSDANVSNADVLQAIFDPTFQTKDLALSEARGRPKMYSELPKIEQRCIVDFTVKSSSDSSEASGIANANAALDMFGIKMSKGSMAGYDAIVSFKNKKKELSSLIENVLSYSSASIEDKYAYSLMFYGMAEQLNGSSGTLFDMGKLKKISHLDPGFLAKNSELASIDGISFEEFLSRTGYGKVMSELLIPFLLLSGYKNLKTISGQTRPIVDGLDEDVRSVEFPQSSIEKLKDYDVVFVNTASKRYAISAKFGDKYNHTSLIALVKDKIKNPNKFGSGGKAKFEDLQNQNSVFGKIVKVCSGSEHTNLAISLKLGKLFLGSLTSKLDEEADREIAIAGFTEFSSDSSESESGEKQKKAGRPKKENTEESIREEVRAVKYEQALAEKLDKDADFLKTVDDFVFSFFGNAEFQQIVLKSDLNVEYFSKSSRSSGNVEDGVAIVSSSSIKRDQSDKTLRRSQRPISGVTLNQPLQIDFKN